MGSRAVRVFSYLFCLSRLIIIDIFGHRYSSASNTFQADWEALAYDQEPNHLRAAQYLNKAISKEEWEDEVLNEVMQKRRTSTTPKTL
jgi:hypothetical protein